MIQIKFDYSTSIVVESVLFTRLMISEDTVVLNVLKIFGYNQLVESMYRSKIEVDVLFMHYGRKRVVE